MRLPETVDFHRLEHIRTMAKSASKMVTNAIDAFVGRNLELAESISDADDEVDALFDEVRDDLIEIVRKDSGDVAAAIDLLMVAKYFERIGDHVLNLGQQLSFTRFLTHPETEPVMV